MDKLSVQLGSCRLPFSGKFPNEYKGSVVKLLLMHHASFSSLCELCFSNRKLYLIFIFFFLNKGGILCFFPKILLKKPSAQKFGKNLENVVQAVASRTHCMLFKLLLWRKITTNRHSAITERLSCLSRDTVGFISIFLVSFVMPLDGFAFCWYD